LELDKLGIQSMAGENATALAEELKKSLGNEFGEVCYHVFNEWCDLYVTWKQFKNVDRHFFSSVMLALCRLSDPPATAGRKNLTAMLFHKFMDTDERATKMVVLLEQVTQSTAFARDWRNRRISHNDFSLKVEQAEPLKTATVELVDRAIAAIHATLAYIYQEFKDAGLHDDVIDGLNNEMVMLNRIYLGVQQQERNLELLKIGKFEQFDFPKWMENT
jgi:hypothetical protein